MRGTLSGLGLAAGLSSLFTMPLFVEARPGGINPYGLGTSPKRSMGKVYRKSNHKRTHGAAASRTKWTGEELREIRALNGIGRPPKR